MIRSYRGVTPNVAPSAYVDPSAQVIGDVAIGARSSIWCNATLRGDINHIHIGDDSNVQDNSVLHVDYGEFPLHIGDRVTAGHSVVLHGCIIEDECLIGIGAIILNGARIGKGSVIAAGALIAEGVAIPPNSLVMGVPGKIRREVNAAERERFHLNWQHYVSLSRKYMEDNA
jgi:gamma-carbonic anhydrase